MRKQKSVKRNFQELRERERGELLRKYYDLFYSKIKIDGDLSEQQKDYLIKTLYYKGTICITKRVGDKKPLLCGYAPNSWNNEDYPIGLDLINKRNIMGVFPESLKAINMVDAVVGYIRPCKQSIYSFVNHQVEKIVETSMVMEINKFAHKMPWVAVCDTTDEPAMKSLIDDLFNDCPVLYAGLSELDKLKVLQGGTFVIDKLRAEKQAEENELKTQLGINNPGQIEKRERVNTDEINANNDETETSGNVYLTPLERFSKDIKDVLGFDISITWNAPLAMPYEEEDDENDEQ